MSHTSRVCADDKRHPGVSRTGIEAASICRRGAAQLKFAVILPTDLGTQNRCGRVTGIAIN
jgi:hypothetical protein